MQLARWAWASVTVWALLAPLGAAADEHPPRPADRQRLLDGAARALMLGQVAAALRDYEAAAAQEHALDIELGIVRSLMRSGEYRRALVYAAHGAGAHGSDVQGALLYSQLLDLGGQAQAARRVSDAAAARVQDGAALTQARHELASDEAAAFEPLPAGWRFMAAAMLIDAGRQALVPLQALGTASTLGLRDGLGRVSRAQVVERDESLRVARVRLERPFDGAPRPRRAPRQPFAGTPAYAVVAMCGAGAIGCPVWPRLQLGFLAAPDALGAGRALGIEIGAAAPGGPVFDPGGHWVGVSSPGVGGGARLIGSAELLEHLGWGDVPADGAANVLPLTPDAIYESALRLSLQAFSVFSAD